jgi:hypothetical protein
MKKTIFSLAIMCIIGYFFIGINGKEKENTLITLEELTGVSKWIILEGSTTVTFEEENAQALKGKHIYINSKYHYGYAINTKDVIITKDGIIADKNNIYLDYIETKDTDIFTKYGMFAKRYTPSELEGIKKKMKNDLRFELYEQEYYNRAYAHLITKIREEINYDNFN